MNPLYYIFIYPIYITIESIFVLAGGFNHPLFSIFIVSLVVSLLCLPFYLQADKYYEKDIEIKKQLNPKIKSIKANFKGDERFLILNEFYKRNRYSPFNQLKTIFGLIIQILVFISAYKFFTGITLDEPVSIWFIKDILKPDNAIIINNIKINILPIIMTIINIISAEVYLKIIKSNKRINSYIIALAFLILLYKSPSILVIYWTFNNIFSLIKNVIMLCIRRSKKDSDEKIEEEKAVPKQLTLIMILCCLSFMLLYSVFIPFQVFDEIPVSEKIYYTRYILECLYTCFGLFLIYPLLYYFNCKYNNKVIFVAITVSLLLSAIINFLYTNKDVFSVDDDFSLFKEKFSSGNILINILLILMFVAFLYIVYKKLKKQHLKIILCSVFTIFISIFLICLYSADKVLFYDDNHISFEINNNNIYKISDKISLSKTNRNVILIFLDSASAYNMNKTILHERDIMNEFDGFVFFSDVKSIAGYTKVSLPSILGGWEYTPDKINIQNYNIVELQSVFMLPIIFSNLGYNINFVDNVIETHIDNYTNYNPKYSGKNSEDNKYKKTLNIISEAFKYNKISVIPYNKNIQKFFDLYSIKYQYKNSKKSIFYSLILSLNPLLKNVLYDKGHYLIYSLNIDDLNTCIDVANLYYIRQNTVFKSLNSTYTVIHNGLPHYGINPKTLMKISKLKNRMNKRENAFRFSISFLNEYMKLLKDNKVYDNTRIIVVSDHGARNEIDKRKENETYPVDNDAIILYKDFNQRGKLKIDNTDLLLPYVNNLILDGLQDEFQNPYTGNNLVHMKNDGRFICGEENYSCYYNVHNVISHEKIGDYCSECEEYYQKQLELQRKAQSLIIAGK